MLSWLILWSWFSIWRQRLGCWKLKQLGWRTKHNKIKCWHRISAKTHRRLPVPMLSIITVLQGKKKDTEVCFSVWRPEEPFRSQACRDTVDYTISLSSLVVRILGSEPQRKTCLPMFTCMPETFAPVLRTTFSNSKLNSEWKWGTIKRSSALW